MKYKLVITSLTQSEISEALDYYAERSPAAAKRFLTIIEEAFNKLEENPQHYSFFGDSGIVRSISLNNFPYSIIFAVGEEEVKVVGLHNNYRDPDELLNRT